MQQKKIKGVFTHALGSVKLSDDASFCRKSSKDTFDKADFNLVSLDTLMKNVFLV